MRRRHYQRSRRPTQQLEADVVATRLLWLLTVIRRTPTPHDDAELADDQLLDQLTTPTPGTPTPTRCRVPR
jgi:hypothetical protein